MLQFIKEGGEMKRGFTLIELLGVILLLGVIAGICTPIVITMLNQSKSKVSDVQKETIEMAAKNYVNANMYNLDDKCNINMISKNKRFSITKIFFYTEFGNKI